MRSKIHPDHKSSPTTIMLSPFMSRIALMVSKESGGNRNHQSRISNGIQLLILQEAENRGIKIKDLLLRITYNN